MGGGEIALVAVVILIPLAIAVAVTLWTLEPAARRAERAKRGGRRGRGVASSPVTGETPSETEDGRDEPREGRP